VELTEKKNKRRTLLFEGDQHVGTIVEQGSELFQWIVPATSGHTSSYDLAYEAIVKELQR
jgi:hypothetical protein